MKELLLFTLLVFLSISARTQVIGDFSLTDIQNDQKISLSDFTSKKAVVVIFTSTSCPFDNYYSERMKELARDYSQRNVQVLFVNSSPGETPKPGEISGLNAPYLDDRQQVVMRLLNASKTPEAFILIPVNGGFRKIYQGAIDNNPQVAEDVKKPYLRQNLDDILSGESLTYADVIPVGCRIRTP